MDHRSLYKASRLIDTSQKINKRAVEAKKERSQKRKDLFLTTRNLQISTNESKCEQKPNDTKNTAKRDEFLTKFMAWKQAKQKRLEEEKKNKVKPFFSAVSTSLFAPTNHTFVPPKGLKMPVKEISSKSRINLTKKEFKLDIPAVIKRTPLMVVNDKGQKAQNTTASRKKRDDTVAKSVGKKTTSSIKKSKLSSLVDATEINQGTQFSTFVTSTTRKSIPQNSDTPCQQNRISPIQPQSTKRKVLPSTKENINIEHKSKNVTRNAIRTTRSKRKNTAEDACPKSNNQSEVKSKEETGDRSCKTGKPGNLIKRKKSKDSADLNITPVSNVKEEVTNYMSPFVTISRGKVNAKTEHEKRNSVYKLENSFCSPEESVEVRRIRETVKYFRKVLNDEIERMHNLCDTWEQYIFDNGSVVIENGIDMIHAAIGQTKLLTSKKLQQFRGLIDKCEQGITAESRNTVEPDQKIEVGDLEGFWSMVQLQIENIDKRFNNLERWKNNNWSDPDEKIEQPKQKLLKVAKPKKNKSQKSSSFLKDILKEAQAAYKKSRQENAAVDEDVIKFPIIKTRASISKRRSSSLTPNRRVLRRKSQVTTPKISVNGKRSSVERPQFSARKSILKTPGTARKSQKSVFFSEELQFKSPNISDDLLRMQEMYDDSSQRSLNLRTRRVILCPDDAM